MIVRAWLWLLDLLRVNFLAYRRVIIWFWVFLLTGIVIAVITIAQLDILVEDINSGFIDINIINATGVGKGVGSFIWGRIVVVFMPLTLMFGFCVLSSVTALIVFPFMALQGYWVVMSCWWVMQEYMLSSIMLLLFYSVWSILVLQVLLAALIWVMKLSAAIRRLGWRAGCRWRDIWFGVGVIVGAEIALALVEYLVYWVFLARIIY